jgi:rSAM/selenodomain-associated transferase 2
MRLSIVIPALNEAAALPQLLRQLGEQQDLDAEIIIADGGSTDDTVEIAQRAGAVTVTSPRGRGRQMNAGAANARGEFLLFLHADSQLASSKLLATALATLRAEIARAGQHSIAGHFPLRFVDGDASAAHFYRHVEGKTRLNRPYSINGDQGLLLSAAFLRQLGGFDERLPFLEDQRIAAKIFAQGRWLLLPGELLTSARRFEAEGHRERYTLMAILMGLYAADVDEFFARATALYATQHETGRLQLQPQVQLIHRIFRERGFFRTVKILYGVGRFVRENAWQLAYWRDQVHDATDLPRLRFYDRWLHPLTRNPAADTLATLLVSGWFFVVLPRQLKHSASIQTEGIS